jgi:hypothetical protein
MIQDLPESSQVITETVAPNGWVWASQIVALLILVAGIALPIVASVICLRHHRADTRLPLWLILVWLVPIAGPLCTLIGLRRGPPPSGQP